MESLTPLDPWAFRWFVVYGDLRVSADRTLHVMISAYADDLPDGQAGADAIAERVRLRYAKSMNAPEAHWISIAVTEVSPSNAYRVGGIL